MGVMGPPINWPKINGRNWGYKCLFIGVITPFITNRGPPCMNSAEFPTWLAMVNHHDFFWGGGNTS